MTKKDLQEIVHGELNLFAGGALPDIIHGELNLFAKDVLPDIIHGELNLFAKDTLPDIVQGIVQGELDVFAKATMPEVVRTIVHGELGEFTEEILMPAVEHLIDDKNALQSNQLMDHVDRRIAIETGEIIATIKGDRERDRRFKRTTVAVFKRHKLARTDEQRLLDESIL